MVPATYEPYPLTVMFTDQVVFITGAGRGIGAATARLFAQHGASIVLNDMDEDACNRVALDIEQQGCPVHQLPGDVTNPSFADHAITSIFATFGRLHVLINNAGFTWDGMLHKMSDDQWSRILEVHTTAPFRLIRAIAPHWRKVTPEPRCIINVSSTSGLHGGIGQINYATAKMGIVGFTKTVAREWGRYGVRCNAVAFGLIDTRLTQPKETANPILMGDHHIPVGIPDSLRQTMFSSIPLGRPGTPDEAAGSILLLASPLASYITGHTLEVTGGLGI